MSDGSHSSFSLQAEIDSDWFVESTPTPMPDPAGEFRRQTEELIKHPFVARWVQFRDGKWWLFINSEPSDWTMFEGKKHDDK
jgi:hypothetical protein